MSSVHQQGTRNTNSFNVLMNHTNTVNYEITLARRAESSKASPWQSTGQAAPEAVSADGSPGPERACA